MESETATGPGALTDGIDWRETGIAGAGAWLVGLLASFVLVTVADLETGDQETLDVAVQAYVEGLGGAYEVSDTGISVIRAVYGAESSNFWGLGAFLHYLVPAVVFVLAGYVLAGRYAEDVDLETARGRLQAWVGGVSLVAVAAVLTVVGAYAFTPPEADPHFLRLLLAAVVSPTVLAGVGAARRVGFGIRSLRGFGAGLGAIVLAFLLWEFVEESVGGAVGYGDPSGADEYLPYVGEFLADHGVTITPGAAPWREQTIFGGGLGSTVGGGGSVPASAYAGGPDPAFVLFLGPAILAGALVYRAGIEDPIAAVGEGARVAFGYFVGVFVLALAVLGQRMNSRYDDLYGSGSEEAVRDQLIQEANMMFGGILPENLLVAGVLWPVVFAALGGVVGAKVLEVRAGSTAPAEGHAGTEPEGTSDGDSSASGAPQSAE